jgi:hypothetical protein
MQSGVNLSTTQLDVDSRLNNHELFSGSVIPLVGQYGHRFPTSILPIFHNETDDELIDQMTFLLLHLHEKKIDITYWYDILTIFQFLSHPGEVDEMMDVMECEIQEHAEKSPDVDKLVRDDETRRLHLPEGRECYKIVSGSFHEWAKSNGLKEKAKIVRYLSDEAFLSLLRRLCIFKDSSANLNPMHGMWTHGVQWRAIFTKQNKTGFLQHSPLLLYQQFGYIDSLFWNGIFDRVNQPTYTAPQYLSACIHQNEKRWPLLAGTMTRQMDKLIAGRYAHIKQKYREAFANDGVVKAVL